VESVISVVYKHCSWIALPTHSDTKHTHAETRGFGVTP